MFNQGVKSLSIVALAFVAQSAVASTAPVVTPAAGVSQVFREQNVKQWTLFLMQTARTSSVEAADETKSSGLDTELIVGYRLSPKLRADVYTSWSKDLSDLRELQMQNTLVRLDQTPIKLNKYLKTRSRLSLTVPTNTVERTEVGLRTAVGLDQRLLFNTSVSGLSGLVSVGVSKNFHQFDQTFEGEPLTSFVLSSRILLNYSFLENFYVEVSPRISERWDYQAAKSASFGLYQELGWSKGVWSVALGHNNEGNLFQENGRESNFSFDSAATGSYYLTLGLSL